MSPRDRPLRIDDELEKSTELRGRVIGEAGREDRNLALRVADRLDEEPAAANGSGGTRVDRDAGARRHKPEDADAARHFLHDLRMKAGRMAQVEDHCAKAAKRRLAADDEGLEREILKAHRFARREAVTLRKQRDEFVLLNEHVLNLRSAEFAGHETEIDAPLQQRWMLRRRRHVLEGN